MLKTTLSWIAAAILAAGIAMLVIAGPPSADPTQMRIEPISQTVVPHAAALACPGPLTLGTTQENKTDLTYDPAFQPVKGSSVLTVSAAALAPIGAPPTARIGPIDGEAPAALTPHGQSAAATLTAPKTGTVLTADAGSSVMTAGAAVTSTASGDLRGLAAAPCVPARADTYLVGGDTRAASTAILVMTNLGQTAAQVKVTVWGVAGRVETGAGTDQIVVPDHTQRAFRIGGVAPDEQRIVVRVQVTGGEVAAYLQDSRLDGLQPAGVDLVVASAAPATSTLLPGIRVGATTGDSPNPALIRLLAPEQQGATATITLLGKDGKVELPGLDEIQLQPGIVSDVALRSLPAGDYAAIVTATGPVVAAASLSDPSDKAGVPMDRAWSPAQQPATTGLLPLSPGIGTSLSLLSTENATGTLQAIGRDGTAGAAVPITSAGSRAQAIALATLGVADPIAISYAFDKPVAIAANLSQGDPAGTMISVLSPTPSSVDETTISIGLGTGLGLS